MTVIPLVERCGTCGHESPRHYPDCARARAMRDHPAGRPVIIVRAKEEEEA